MTELKLRVGGAYIDRRGERVVIVHDDGEYGAYRFGSATGRYYTPDGRWSVGLDSPYDLVSEVTEAPKDRDKFTIDGRGPMPTFEIAINAHENLRTRAALAAMTGILASGVWVDWSERSVADAALRHADALIAALKGATHIGTLPEVK